jgi:uncharacterized protein (TIGR02301 family)
MRRAAALLLTLSLALPFEALGQQEPAKPLRRKKPAIVAPVQPPAPVVPPISPHEAPLVQLAETMGALAFLAGLCQPAGTPNSWERRMGEFLDVEGENSGLRARLTGAYNQGFSDFSTSYRQCTDAAKAARGVLTREAARLARDIERRFGT